MSSEAIRDHPFPGIHYHLHVCVIKVTIKKVCLEIVIA